jgi:hypothetical protein
MIVRYVIEAEVCICTHMIDREMKSELWELNEKVQLLI